MLIGSAGPGDGGAVDGNNGSVGDGVRLIFFTTGGGAGAGGASANHVVIKTAATVKTKAATQR